MKIRPLSDRIVIRPAQAEEKTKGGIIVPDTAKDKPVRGEITAAGPGKTSEDGKRIPLDLKVGDNVLYGKYSGTEVTVDEEDLLIMRESDVFAILTDGKAK
ncbi:MAG: co-chaperone GroES [Bacteroidota bacterium]